MGAMWKMPPRHMGHCTEEISHFAGPEQQRPCNVQASNGGNGGRLGVHSTVQLDRAATRLLQEEHELARDTATPGRGVLWESEAVRRRRLANRASPWLARNPIKAGRPFCFL